MKSLKLTLIMLLICSVLYPAVVWGFALIAGPNGGKAETVQRNGKPVGAALVGQAFAGDAYFQGRPSAVDYNGGGSGGGNKGPSNPDYLQTVQARVDTFLVHNPGVAKSQVPSELVTASGSGLDPHLSPQAAKIQAARVARLRNLTQAQVLQLIDSHTERPMLGPAVVHVLRLNLALEQAKSL